MQFALLCITLMCAVQFASASGPGSQSRMVAADSTKQSYKESPKDTMQSAISDSTPRVSLDIEEYWVVDTAESISFRLHVQNSSDSLVIIDRVEPSCGCILTTVQKSFARKGKDGEIYVALMTGRMSDIQPYTVDVYTSADPDRPLRMFIRKKSAADNTGNR